MSDRRPIDVERTPEHRQAEALLASLRARRKAAKVRVDALVGISPAKQRAIADHDALHAEVLATLRALAPMRSRHLQNTRAAFREPRRDAAKRALAALSEAEAACAALDAMSGEMRRLGGEHRDLQAGKVLMYLILPLQRLAREKGDGS